MRPLARRSLSAVAHVPEGCLGGDERHRAHLGAHADLGLGLDLAHAGEGRADRAEQRGRHRPAAARRGSASPGGAPSRSPNHDQTSSVA